MRKYLLLLIACFTLVSCQRIAENVICGILSIGACKKEFNIADGFRYDVKLRMTPVKDQGKSEFCWIYAMLATIETEHLMQEDSVNLSVDYVARMYLEEQAMERFRTKGKHEISQRGMAPMTVDIIEKYGVVPHDSYYPKEPINYNVLQRKISKVVDVALAHRWNEARCLNDVRDMLDKEVGYLPRKVFMFGMEYTFLEFAHSVCMPKEYESLTSDDSQPIGKIMELPYKDNYYYCKALNVDADSLVARAKKSLREGHPVMWEGGPDDNHAVCIIGMGKDVDGEFRFVAKNSWGDDNPTKGLLFISEEDVHDRTAVLVVKRED